MKIFILEPSFLNIGNNITKKLISLNNNLTICKKYSSSINYISNNDDFINYMNIDDINLSFKNNHLLYITYNNSEIICTSIDNFLNSDVLPIKYNEFNNIIPNYYNDILVICLDSKHVYDNKKQQKHDISAYKHTEESISKFNLKYLYFCGDTEDEITTIINDYILGDNAKRDELEKEYA